MPWCFRRSGRAWEGGCAWPSRGGAPLSDPIADFFQGLGVWIVEGYGLTETSTVTHANRIDRYRVGTVGLALDGVECRIADDGEILIRGANIMKGYLKDPAATAEAIDPDGWFHTGDVGRIEDGGFLRITDRKKDLIVTSGGKNIAPQMIENHLRQEPLISQAMVWGDRTSHLVALITLDEEEARRWVEKEGPGWEGLEEARGGFPARGAPPTTDSRTQQGLGGLRSRARLSDSAGGFLHGHRGVDAESEAEAADRDGALRGPARRDAEVALKGGDGDPAGGGGGRIRTAAWRFCRPLP